MEAFQNYSFESDETWIEYERNLTIPDGKEHLLMKKRAQWYQRNVDEDFDVDAALADLGLSAKPAAAAKPKEPVEEEKKIPTHKTSPSPAQRPTAAAAQTTSNAPQQPSPLSEYDTWGLALLGAHAWLLLAVVISLNPFNTFLAYKMYYQACRVSLVVHLVRLFKRFPFQGVEHAKGWFQQVAGTTEFYYSIGSITLMNNPHIWLLSLAFAVMAVYHMSAYLRDNYHTTVAWRTYGHPIHSILVQFQPQALKLMALLEIGTFFQALVGVFRVGPRSLMVAWLCLNQLKLRYINADSRLQHIEMWKLINAKAQPLLDAVPMLKNAAGMAERWFNQQPVAAGATQPERAHAE